MTKTNFILKRYVWEILMLPLEGIDMAKEDTPITVNTTPVSANLILPLDIDYKEESKLNEDQYEVYVNGKLIGHKSLKNQGEKLTDIDDFLRIQGITHFSTSLIGDHYNIQTDSQDNDITDALSVYFNNR
jgi:hypothetical protein